MSRHGIADLIKGAFSLHCITWLYFMSSMTTEAQKKILVEVAASLLMSRLPDFKEDYKFKVPNYHLKEIEKHNETLRLNAIKLRRVVDGI